MTFKNYSDSWNNKKDIVLDEVEDIQPDEPKLGTVFNCEKVYLRESPSQDSDHVEILDKGAELFIDFIDGNWCKVTIASGREGYVMKKFVKIDD